jgi:site-specific recombinase XerD
MAKHLPTLTTSLSEFLIAQEADGNSDATLQWYGHLLGQFKNGMSEGADRRIGEVAAGDIRRYIVGLRSRDLADATVASHIRALHKFWGWVAKEYDISNPMRNVAYPKMKQPKVRAADLDDITKLFQSAGTRDRAIIAFLLDTGCRAAGLCSLKMHDLDMEQRRAMVTEKGSKTRAVVFTDFTAQVIQAWLGERQQSDVVFYSEDFDALKPNGLRQVLRRLAKRAGVTGRHNPHALRHTFAREYILNGGDLATLAKLLGHNDVSTTVAHYSVFTDQEIKDAHEKYSPAKALGKP